MQLYWVGHVGVQSTGSLRTAIERPQGSRRAAGGARDCRLAECAAASRGRPRIRPHAPRTPRAAVPDVPPGEGGPPHGRHPVGAFRPGPPGTRFPRTHPQECRRRHNRCRRALAVRTRHEQPPLTSVPPASRNENHSDPSRCPRRFHHRSLKPCMTSKGVSATLDEIRHDASWTGVNITDLLLPASANAGHTIACLVRACMSTEQRSSCSPVPAMLGSGTWPLFTRRGAERALHQRFLPPACVMLRPCWPKSRD
jgi:hypothetical protein